MMLSKTALIELTYNLLCNQISTIQRQQKLTNDDMDVIITRISQDIKSMKLVESADTILKLSQRVEELEKKEAGNDKPDDQS